MINTPKTAVVVGASIAGLGCALGLTLEGFHVTVLEAKDMADRKRDIVHCPPNMTRILQSWGVKVDDFGCQFKGFVFREGNHDKLIGALDIPDEMIEDLGAEYRYLDYAGLHQVLMDKVQEAGAVINPNSKVYHVDLGSGKVSFNRDQNISADLVVIADGSDSTHRTGLIQESSPDEDSPMLECTELEEEVNPPGDYTHWIGRVSKDDMEQAEEFGFDRPGRITFWMATCATFWSLSADNGDLHIFLRHSLNSNSERDTFALQPDVVPPSVLEMFSPMVHQLMRLGKLKHFQQEPPRLSPAVAINGKCIIIGDAAHPWMPSSTQRQAMGIEDAATIQRLVSLNVPSHVVPSAYYSIRGDRWQNAFISDRSKFEYVSLPPGPCRTERDETLQMAACIMGEESDCFLRLTWEDYLGFFNHDATEAVDEWWHVARHSPSYSD